MNCQNLQERKSGILYLDGDLTDETKGTHWEEWYKNNNKSYTLTLEYYGIPLLKLLIIWAVLFLYSTDQIQNFDQVICRHLCLCILKFSPGIGLESTDDEIPKSDRRNITTHTHTNTNTYIHTRALEQVTFLALAEARTLASILLLSALHSRCI